MEKIQTNDVSCDIAKQQHEPFNKDKIDLSTQKKQPTESEMKAMFANLGVQYQEQAETELNKLGFDRHNSDIIINKISGQRIGSKVTVNGVEQKQISKPVIGKEEPFIVGNDIYEFVDDDEGLVVEKRTAQNLKWRGITNKATSIEDLVEAGKILYFSNFCREVSFLEYEQVVNKRINIAPKPVHEFDTKFAMKVRNNDNADMIATSIKLVKHIFGDEIVEGYGERWRMGLQYLALLIQRPSHSLPVLCLVSSQNKTGKTTFADDMLTYLLGSCVGVYDDRDLRSDFNTCYLSHVSVFEEISDAKNSIDSIKRMATAYRATINKKFEAQKNVKVCPHIIINSNNETGFIKASDEDIRYWVIKVPELQDEDPDFKEKLKAESKAFFHFLAMYPIGEKKSRMWFDVKSVETSALQILRAESKSECAKVLKEIIENELANYIGKETFVEFTATDLKEMFGDILRDYNVNQICKALIDELHIEQAKTKKDYSNPLGKKKRNTRPFKVNF